MGFCKNCSYELNDDWILCPKCGQKCQKEDKFYYEEKKETPIETSSSTSFSNRREIILSLVDSFTKKVGKTILVDVLKGSKNKKIMSKDLNRNKYYGHFSYMTSGEISDLIDDMIQNNLLEVKYFKHMGKFPRPVIYRGTGEAAKPIDPSKYKTDSLNIDSDVLSDDELLKIKESKVDLDMYDDGQKRAIISESIRLLCIAGAGSGKTTVLTKRIEHLVKTKGVDPSKILAITFTRHAAKQMKERLNNVASTATICTFNSFCETNLQKYEHHYYDKPQTVLSYRQSIKLLSDCFSELRISLSGLYRDYFGNGSLDRSSDFELRGQLFNDIFSVVDYLKNEDLEPDAILDTLNYQKNYSDKNLAQIIHDVVKVYLSKMKYIGFRDYSDQVLHFYKLLCKNNSVCDQIKDKYDYIFIDEYQDVNTIQVKLIDKILRNDSNLFVVGDPRQSIFGFRGSDIKHIMNFSKKYNDSKVVSLKTNYRSAKNIIEIANTSIKEMGITPQVGVKDFTEDVYLIECETEEREAEFISNHMLRLIASGIKPCELFVISRTNAQLNYITEHLNAKGIHVLKKSVELHNMSKEALDNQVTVSTVHAIKGLEAKHVFVTGLVSSVFPSFTKDKAVVSTIKHKYSKSIIDEEKRLFYVALTRAKEGLYVSHYKKNVNGKKRSKSTFLTEELTVLFKEDYY